MLVKVKSQIQLSTGDNKTGVVIKDRDLRFDMSKAKATGELKAWTSETNFNNSEEGLYAKVGGVKVTNYSYDIPASDADEINSSGEFTVLGQNHKSRYLAALALALDVQEADLEILQLIT